MAFSLCVLVTKPYLVTNLNLGPYIIILLRQPFSSVVLTVRNKVDIFTSYINRGST